PGGAPPRPTTTPEGQKRLQAMRDEIVLTRLTGVARARLAAIQRLGADATDEERAEAERLATELYNLQKAQDAVKKATEEAGRAEKKAVRERGAEARPSEEATPPRTDQQTKPTQRPAELRKRKPDLHRGKSATPGKSRRGAQ